MFPLSSVPELNMTLTTLSCEPGGHMGMISAVCVSFPAAPAGRDRVGTSGADWLLADGADTMAG